MANMIREMANQTQMMFGGKNWNDEELERPTWNMPESVGKMTDIFEQSAKAGMPGEDQLKEDIYGSTASGLSQISQLSAGSPEAMTGLLGLKEQEKKSLSDLQTKSAMYQSQQQGNLASAYGQKAEWENLGWDWNEGRRWGEAKNEEWAQKQQQQQTIQSIIDLVGGLGPLAFG